MRDILLNELKVNTKIINISEDDHVKAEGKKLLLDTVDKMLELSLLARHEGILALEEAAESSLVEFPGGRYLKNMLCLIVDGTDPALLDEICINKYFTLGIEGYDAIQYIMMLSGILDIQAGVNTRVIEKQLLSMLSDELSDEYEAKKKLSRS